MSKAAEDIFKEFDWSLYYKNKSNQTPRDTLVKALELFKNKTRETGQRFAIDVGSGHGTDTIELLKQGWKVLAIDNDENGLTLLKKSVDPGFKKNLETSRQAFEEIKLKHCNLLNAGYCIPFCRPEAFDKFWKKIENAVIPNGRFAGNFFGDKDSWSEIKTMTFHKRDEVKILFKKFEIEVFEERDEDGITSIGESKHWHVFNVIARKL